MPNLTSKEGVHKNKQTKPTNPPMPSLSESLDNLFISTNWINLVLQEKYFELLTWWCKMFPTIQIECYKNIDVRIKVNHYTNDDIIL